MKIDYNKKITVYLTHDNKTELEHIADLLAIDTDGDWLVEEELGLFAKVCNCGSANCKHAGVMV